MKIFPNQISFKKIDEYINASFPTFKSGLLNFWYNNAKIYPCKISLKIFSHFKKYFSMSNKTCAKLSCDFVASFGVPGT